jgi:hypothetical protein
VAIIKAKKLFGLALVLLLATMAYFGGKFGIGQGRYLGEFFGQNSASADTPGGGSEGGGSEGGADSGSPDSCCGNG